VATLYPVNVVLPCGLGFSNFDSLAGLIARIEMIFSCRLLTGLFPFRIFVVTHEPLLLLRDKFPADAPFQIRRIRPPIGAVGMERALSRITFDPQRPLCHRGCSRLDRKTVVSGCDLEHHPLILFVVHLLG